MRLILFSIFVFISYSGFSQKTLEKLLDKYNTESIPYILVDSLAKDKTQPILLDARELKEYNVSHLKNAIHVGYDHFELDAIVPKLADKNSKIIVYCSLGIRSEDIAEKIKNAGYTNVYNLYGGIFEWKNKALPVFTNEGEETQNIHAFSKAWSRWLTKGVKVYD